ncbi:hypothetical protein BGX38DRAFT_1152778, partial [Terfezia claveryi]
MQTSLFLQLLFAYLAVAQVHAPDEGSNPETVQDGVVVYPTATLNTGRPATSVLPELPSDIGTSPGPIGPGGPGGGGEPVAILPPAPEPLPYPTGPVETPEHVGPIGPGHLAPTVPGSGPSIPTGPGGPVAPPPGGPVPVPVPTGHPGPPGLPSGPTPPGATGPGTGYPPTALGATPTGPPTGPPPPYLSGGDRSVNAKLGSGALVALICAVAM